MGLAETQSSFVEYGYSLLYDYDYEYFVNVTNGQGQPCGKGLDRL